VEGRECEEGAVVGGAEGAAEGEEGGADEGAEGTAECAASAGGSAGREEGSCWTEPRMEESCCVGGLKLMVEEVGGGDRPRMEVAGSTTALLTVPPTTPAALLTTVAGSTTALSTAPPSTPAALLTTVAGLTTAAASLLDDEDDDADGEAEEALSAWGEIGGEAGGGAFRAVSSPIWAL
jgi:hypothetical protein